MARICAHQRKIVVSFAISCGLSYQRGCSTPVAFRDHLLQSTRNVDVAQETIWRASQGSSGPHHASCEQSQASRLFVHAGIPRPPVQFHSSANGYHGQWYSKLRDCRLDSSRPDIRIQGRQ